MYAVSREGLWQLLRPVLGTRLLAQSGVTDTLGARMDAFVPARESLASLEKALEEALFSALYTVRMRPALDDGRTCRISTDSLGILADDCLFYLFAAMERSHRSFLLLRGYAMEEGSRSAQAALFLLYADEMTPEEREVLRRVLSARYDPAPDWLKNH